MLNNVEQDCPEAERSSWADLKTRGDAEPTLESIEDDVISAATARNWKDINPALVVVGAMCVASAFL